jgi:chemotaxis protein methyltransferase CheR
MTSDLHGLKRFLHEASGLTLDDNKAYLIESRLSPLMRRAGVANISDLLSSIKGGRDSALKQSVIDAMMTNETFFFRDRVPFDNFRNVILPKLMEARREQRRIRIWCAAASTGQEPYSLTMILDEEAKKLTGWNIEILATDLSSTAIASAREGHYTQFEVQRGLPISHLLRYFRSEDGGWRINEHLRARVRFEEFNLLTDFREFGQFDLIFCRNVLIYFDLETKKNILQRLGGALMEDGFLIMGSAETVVGLADRLMPHPTLRLTSVHRPEPVALPPRPTRLAARNAPASSVTMFENRQFFRL